MGPMWVYRPVLRFVLGLVLASMACAEGSRPRIGEGADGATRVTSGDAGGTGVERDAAPTSRVDSGTAGARDASAAPVTDAGGSSGPSLDAAPEIVVDAGAPVSGDRYSLTVLRGSSHASKASGLGWDPLGGLPDLFVEVTVGGQRASTTPLTDSLTPAWAEPVGTFDRADLLMPIDVWMWDLDFTEHDPVGHCPLMLTESDFSAEEVLLDCPRDAGLGQAGFQVVFRLSPG